MSNASRVLLVVILVLGLIMAWRIGYQAEKRWQDSYYAAHPVVKEVPPTIDYNKLVFWKDESGAICRLDDSFPERNYTCLDLPKPHDGLCEGWAGIWWGPRPCPVLRPAPPKKAKPAKAKRHELTCKDIGGCAVVVPGQDLRINCAPNFDCNKHSDIDPQGAVCVAGSSDGHPIEAPCPQITWPTRKP